MYMCAFVCVCVCVSIGCIYELYWRLKVDIILHRALNFQATILRFHQWKKKKNIHTKSHKGKKWISVDSHLHLHQVYSH